MVLSQILWSFLPLRPILLSLSDFHHFVVIETMWRVLFALNFFHRFLFSTVGPRYSRRRAMHQKYISSFHTVFLKSHWMTFYTCLLGIMPGLRVFWTSQMIPFTLHPSCSLCFSEQESDLNFSWSLEELNSDRRGIRCAFWLTQTSQEPYCTWSCVHRRTYTGGWNYFLFEINHHHLLFWSSPRESALHSFC